MEKISNALELKEKYLAEITQSCEGLKNEVAEQKMKVTRLTKRLAEFEQKSVRIKENLDSLNRQAALTIAKAKPIEDIQKKIRQLRLDLEDSDDIQVKLSGEVLPAEEQDLKNKETALTTWFISESVRIRRETFDEVMDSLAIQMGDLRIEYDRGLRAAVPSIGVRMAWGTITHQELGQVSYFSEEAGEKIGIVFA